MKLNVNFSELTTVVQRMGARASSWSPNVENLGDLQRLVKELEEGIEIPLGEVETVHGGLLCYKGEQVVLYIKDTRQDRQTLLHDFESSRRFHVAECRTLRDMRHKGRFERYVVTTRKDGLFSVEATDYITKEHEELEAPLRVCKNCLNALNWRRYSTVSSASKWQLWVDFSLDDFFSEFSTFFYSKPQHSDATAPRGGYAKHWSEVSYRIREERGWKCEICKVILSQYPSLLHCHHRNGVTSDNSDKNIAVLCKLCHAEQPGHSRLKPSSKDRVVIEGLRRKASES